ncbi:MAG: hypothetical protein ABEI52_01130, partial [Halobacteriaceae archaeon]
MLGTSSPMPIDGPPEPGLEVDVTLDLVALTDRPTGGVAAAVRPAGPAGVPPPVVGGVHDIGLASITKNFR